MQTQITAQPTEFDGQPPRLKILMENYFYASEEAQILFKGWKTTTVASMACSVLFVFLFSILYEFVKAYRMYKPRKCNNPETIPLLSDNRHQIGLEARWPSRFNIWQHLQETLFFLLNFVFAYFLMLIAMTYNIWLFLAIILGYGLGYFVGQPLCEYYLSESTGQETEEPYYGVMNRPSGSVVL